LHAINATQVVIAIAMPAVTLATPMIAAGLGISPSRKIAATVVTEGTAAVNKDVSTAPSEATARLYTKIDAAQISTP